MIPPHTVRLEFNSAFDMLDFVQVISDHICTQVGLDEDQLHWVSVGAESSSPPHMAKERPGKRGSSNSARCRRAGDALVLRSKTRAGFVRKNRRSPGQKSQSRPRNILDSQLMTNVLKGAGRMEIQGQEAAKSGRDRRLAKASRAG